MTSSFTSDGTGGFTFSVFAPPPPVPEMYRSEEGTGYPSCSRALAKIPPNFNDANGYYALLGVEPWSPMPEIKRALRKKLALHHPDGPEPDLKLFMRFKEIATVLTNPIHKANYDSIPRGRKLIDSVVLEQMEEQGIQADSPGVQQFAASPEDMGTDSNTGRKVKPKERYWDYLATEHNELDLINAQEWYAYLLEVAPIFRFEATIKILLHDGRSSAFKKMGSIMLIPRGWEPSVLLAFAMMERHLGLPDYTKPRYNHGEEQEPAFTVTRPRWSGTGLNGGGGLLAVRTPNVTDAV